MSIKWTTEHTKNNNYDNFEKLYKELTGKDHKTGDSVSRIEGMTDKDWELFEIYNNRYNQEKATTDTFNDNKANLEEQEKQARIQADIQMDRLNKYLPQQMNNRGLGGATNLTESAMIQAMNNYQNQLGKIDNDYSKLQLDLLNNYNTNMQNIGSDYTTQENNTIKDYYDNATLTESSILENKYKNAIGTDEQISQKDYDALNSYIESLYDSVGSSGIQTLKNQLREYSPFIRSESDQKTYDENETLSKYKTGVGLSDGVNVSSEFGGGFELAPTEKVKIKEGDSGLSVHEFYQKAGKSGKGGLNNGESGWMGTERLTAQQIAVAGVNGKLKDGTIVDTNRGSGQKLWIYLNGRFYQIERI